MHFKSALLTIIFATGFLATNVVAQNKGSAFRVLPVHQTDDKMHFLMPMTVEGRESHFLLDTGCGYSAVVSLKLAKELKKDLGKASEMEGVGGNSQAYEVAFDQFKLGGVYAVQFKKTHVTDMSEFSASKLKGKSITPKGMIGSKTLMAIRGVFDAAAGHVLVPPADAAKGIYKRSMEGKGALVLPLAKKAFSRPYIEVTLKGKKFLFLVDTGATTCLIEPEIAKELELKATGTSSPVVGKGDEVIKGASRTKVKDVMLGGKVKIPSLGFTVLKTGGLSETDIPYGGIIGVPVLNAVHAQLDFDTYSLIIPKRQP